VRYAKQCLHRKRGSLWIENCRVDQLAQELGTPSFLVCEAHLRQNFRRVKDAFERYYDKVEIAYSYKTNFEPAICAILNEEGAWAEVVSGLELGIAERIKVDPSRIVFNGPAKSNDELFEASRLGIGMLNVDSIAELQRVVHLSKDSDCEINVGLRLCPPWYWRGEKSKFGLSPNLEIMKAGKMISCNESLRFVGLHFHLGTQIKGVGLYAKMTRHLVAVAERLKRRFGLVSEIIDVGGGFPETNLRNRKNVQTSFPELGRFSSAVGRTLKEAVMGAKIEAPTLVVEPGRSVVARSFFMLTKVVATKRGPAGSRWVIVDAGLNLIPEAEYYQHRIIPSKIGSKSRFSTNVGGPLCMYEDHLGLGLRLPRIKEGDILLIPDAGAYSVSLSWQFMKPRAPVYLLRGDRIFTIRKRERMEDVLILERLPSHLGAKS
jgi:diaminopimelate decarboxylase